MRKHSAIELDIPKHHQNSRYMAHAGNHLNPVNEPDLAVDSKRRLISISPALARRLHIPARPYLIYYADFQGLYLGPVIGILISSLRPEGHPGPYEAKIYREMVKYARKRGVLIYLFNASGVGKKNGMIKGISLNAANKWYTSLFPRPDIVYNRIRRRRLENTAHIEGLLKQFQDDPAIHLFNSRFLYKWEVYETLSAVPEVCGLFPLTLQFTHKNLNIMLKQCEEVLLKPDHGSLGKGIIKIVPKGSGFSVATSAKPTKWKKCSSVDNLYNLLKEEMGNRDGLLQRGIKLCTLKGNVFDMRAQFQKDGSGAWVHTGAAFRVAGKGQFVTHIPNGGRAETYETVIRQTFPSPSTRTGLRDQLSFICSHVPALLEERLGLNLAIVSMDIGIDSQGKMWILEVNSKPTHFDETDIRRRHLQLLIDYCIFAAAEQRRN